MKNYSKKLLAGAAVTLFIVMGMASIGSAELLTLPDPTQQYDGQYVAWAHDDFWSFSSALISDLQGTGAIPTSYGDYAAATGTGGLDLILYSGAVGANNLGINTTSGPTDFEDPAYDSDHGTHSYVGTWGAGIQDNGPVTVGMVLDYLHYINPDNNTPYFMLDLNQTGSSPNLDFVGRVYLKDGDGQIVEEWAFDESAQPGTDDIDDPARGDADEDHPGFSVPGDFNADATALAIAFGGGSGKLDYVAYAPMMDLSLFDRDLLFVTEFHMGTGDNPLNGGFEEIFLSGGFTTKSPETVPEPATILLLGLGMVGLAGVRKKIRK